MNFCSFYYICEQRFYARPRRQKDEEFRDAVPPRRHVGPAAGVRACIRSRGYHRVSRERFPRCLRVVCAFARASSVCCVPCARPLGATETVRVLHRGSAAGSRLRPREAVAGRSGGMRLLPLCLRQHFHRPLTALEYPQMLRFCGCAAPSPPRGRPRSAAGAFLPAGPCGRLPLRSIVQTGCRRRRLRKGDKEHEVLTKAFGHPTGHASYAPGALSLPFLDVPSPALAVASACGRPARKASLPVPLEGRPFHVRFSPPSYLCLRWRRCPGAR